MSLELDIDRMQNLGLRLGIERFQIEDVQTELPIAAPFRVCCY